MRHCLLFVTVLCLWTQCGTAEDPCTVPVTELQAGVYEADMGNVKIKTEAYNKIAKMKLISALNEDWTSVSTDGAVGQITGYYGNGADAKLAAHLVIDQGEGGFEWSVFKSDIKSEAGKGIAYFYFAGKISCAPTTLYAWKSAIAKVITAPGEVGVVNVSNDSL